MLKLTGGKPKFAQITRGKFKFAQITGGEIFHEGPKPKNLQITRMKLKKIFYRRQKPKMTYIIR